MGRENCREMIAVTSKVPSGIIRSLLSVVSCAALLLLGTPCHVHSVAIPEKLIYELTWTGIKAGTAIQEIAYEGGNVRIVSTARSTDWINTFFPVEDRIETVLVRKQSTAFGLPKSYRMKIREGKTRRDKEILFDHAKRTALYIDHLGGERKNVAIDDKTLDTLSSFYYVRSLPLQIGKSIYVTVFDGKKLWDTEVQILRREKIKTKLGTFNTIVVKPLMKSEGIFEKKGDMHIWLTDDAKRLPVRMKTKVPVGSITATLVGGTY